MPIYEYTCEACGAVNEVLQSFRAPPPETCQKCGGGPLHKLVSQSSFILKGGGWYKDGYAGTSNKVGSESSSSSSSDSSSSSTSSSDSSSSDSSSSSADSSSSSSSSD